jgi:hypothetical protein
MASSTIIVGMPGAIKGAKSTIPPGRRITAELASIDTGLKITFELPPSESSRDCGATWTDVGVCESDTNPIEYQHTKAERRQYRVVLDGYHKPGGIANSVEKDLRKLKLLTKKVPGLQRSHRCVYTQGEQTFGPCVLEDWHAEITRVALSGGALRADVQLQLKEL